MLIIFAKPIYGTTDDYILNSWLNGSYTGIHENESIFISSIFSNSLSYLYSIFPNISWYAFVLLLVTLAAIVTLNQYINRNNKISNSVKNLNLIILAAYLSWSILGITYTATAIIAGVAGWVSIKEWLVNEKKQTFIIACLFTLLSICIRPESFLGATLIISPFILFKIKINRALILKLILFASFVFSVLLLNRYIESKSTNEMKDYKNWAEKVQMFAGRPRMSDATKVIGNTGWTVSEYHLFADLAYFDNSNFNTKWIDQGIEATDKISNRPTINYEKIKGITVEYFKSITIFGYTLFFIFILLLYSLTMNINRLAVSFVVLNYIIIHLLSGIFLHNVSRVTIPLLVVLCYMLSHFVQLDFKNKYLNLASYFFVLIFVVFFFQQNTTNIHKIKSAEIYRSSIVVEQKDKIVFIQGNQEYFQNSNPFVPLSKDPDPNVFMVGNWDTFSPQWFKRAKLIGLNENSLIKSLLKNPKVYWSGPAVPDTMSHLINYLKESGYGVYEPKKVGLLPNGNELWSFSQAGGTSEA